MPPITPTNVPPPQRLSYTCTGCKTVRTVTLSHYDMTDCGNCGKKHWALQPKRPGPLVVFPHPGFQVGTVYQPVYS